MATERAWTRRRIGLVALGAAAVVGLTFSVLVGILSLVVDLPNLARVIPTGEWGVDGTRHMQAAQAALAGRDPYGVDRFLYAPLAVWAMMPFAALGTSAGLFAFLIVKVGLLAWFIVDATRPCPRSQRIVIGIVMTTWIFVLDDLWLGNVTIILVAAMWFAISRDRAAAGIPLGLVLAAFAKPFLLPFLLWMVAYRRRGLVGAIVTAGVATVIGFAVGPAAYQAYLRTLSDASRVTWDFPGNLGLSASAPGLLLPMSVLVLAVYVVLLWRSRDESGLLAWSLLVGLIAAPYVAIYGPSQLLAGVVPFVRAHPVRALAVAAIVLPMMFFNLMVATVVALVLTFPRDALGRPRTVDPSPVEAAGVGP